MNSYFHLQWKEFPTPMVDSSFCYFRENQGWFWQSQGGWIKQMERMGPHTSLGQSIPGCDKDILLTDASRTQKNHVLLKRGCFEKFIFKRRHRELGKNKLNFPNDLGGWESLDCRIWATPYSERLRNHGRKEYLFNPNWNKQGKRILEWLDTKAEEV